MSYYGGKREREKEREREREMIDEGEMDIRDALTRKRWGIVDFVGNEKDA